MGKEFHFQYFRNANLVYIFSKVFEEIIRISKKVTGCKVQKNFNFSKPQDFMFLNQKVKYLSKIIFEVQFERGIHL